MSQWSMSEQSPPWNYLSLLGWVCKLQGELLRVVGTQSNGTQGGTNSFIKKGTTGTSGTSQETRDTRKAGAEGSTGRPQTMSKGYNKPFSYTHEEIFAFSKD